MKVFPNTTFLAAGPESERGRSAVKRVIEVRMKQAHPSSKENLNGERQTVSRGELCALVPLFLVVAGFLFGNLGTKYLWQDEAATAVLGDRLMKFGEPLAYDGVNLITMDHIVGEDVATVDQRTGAPEAAIQYYTDRGDFKRNTAWVGQPWGQFIVVGMSLTLLGHTTEAARLPFVLASLLTVGLLYWIVRQQFQDRVLAWLAAALLVANVYWVIYGRQCRYYALTGLFLLLTLMAFTRWQRERPWGGPVFVVTAWCWFQVDFGSFWPMLGILLLTAAWNAWPHVQRPVLVGLALGAAIAPWVWYYELAGRVKASAASWSDKFLLNLYHVNQYLLPLPLLLLAAAILARRWRTLPPPARQVLIPSLAMLLAALVWVPTVTPYAFHRYIVHLAPLAALTVAWVLCEIATWVTRRHPREGRRVLVAGSLAVFVAVSPLIANLAGVPHPHTVPSARFPGPFIRPEWAVLYEEVFAPLPDPNRLTVEALARVVSAGDEVLINYEDIPLMFYTDCRIRGGIPCFRVEDSSQGPPRFLVYRRSVSFVDGSVFRREILRSRWQPIRSGAPDVAWGNIPEPELRALCVPSPAAPEIIMAEYLGPAMKGQPPGREHDEKE
jgi:hypothetical protein